MATTEKKTFKDYRLAVGLTPSSLPWKVESMTGIHISSDLIDEIERELLTPDERPKAPIAQPKAEALAKFFSFELGRTISVEDLGLETI